MLLSTPCRSWWSRQHQGPSCSSTGSPESPVLGKPWWTETLPLNLFHSSSTLHPFFFWTFSNKVLVTSLASLRYSAPLHDGVPWLNLRIYSLKLAHEHAFSRHSHAFFFKIVAFSFRYFLFYFLLALVFLKQLTNRNSIILAFGMLSLTPNELSKHRRQF